jgi:hypothetical protein
MLQTAAVEPGTLALLKRLMTLPSLEKLNLVGGTSLALQLGHRISIDLDLFGLELPDKEHFLNEVGLYSEPISVQDYFFAYRIEGVKVDILKFPYPLIRPVLIDEGVRLASLEDIAAMKLIAVSNRGSKKDFFDLAVLLDHFDLREMLAFYEEKCGRELPTYVLRSLCFFEDAEQDAHPEMLIKLSWDAVKNKIEIAVKNLFDSKD